MMTQDQFHTDRKLDDASLNTLSCLLNGLEYVLSVRARLSSCYLSNLSPVWSG